MHRPIALAVLGIAVLAGCSTSAPTLPGDPSAAAESDGQRPPSPPKSIVSAMTSSYLEVPELLTDPCEDRIIHTMRARGYELSDLSEPHTLTQQGSVYTGCSYRAADSASALLVASTSAALRSMSGQVNIDHIERYSTTINNRFALVSPFSAESRSCLVAIEMSYGQFRIVGSPPRTATPAHDPCGFTKNVIADLEPELYD